MSKRIAVAAGILAAGLVAGTAATASAHVITNPTPTPATSSPDYTPSHHHVRPVVVPWQFDLQQSDIGRAPALNILVNDVESGPTGIIMRNWRDVQINPNVDVFRRGPNSVTLLHDDLSLANIDTNLRTCTVTINQDGRFRILNGTGTGAGFRSRNGEFVLQGLVSYPLIRDRFCPLAFVGSGRLLRALEGNLNVAGQLPSFVDISVQGRADLVRVRPLPVPYPTGPGHIFAPTVTPTESLPA